MSGPIRAAPRLGVAHALSWPAWEALAGAPLLAMWAEPAAVLAVFVDAQGPVLARLEAPERRFPSLGAAREERALRDLWGLEGLPATDDRPLLDHGRWPVLHPLSGRPVRHEAPPPQPVFRAVAAASQLGLGPVLPGFEPPLHLRLHLVSWPPGLPQAAAGAPGVSAAAQAPGASALDGERIAGAEAQPGYAHRGLLSLLPGKSPRAAARFPARLAGDATVAHGLAFALAAEAALGVVVPRRAVALRLVLAEAERLAVLLGQWAVLAEAAGEALPAARAGLLREAWLRACAAAFGHRLLMDRVQPGGVAADIAPEGAPLLLGALHAIGRDRPLLARAGAALERRLAGLGVARGALGGIAARAGGAAWDARQSQDAYAALEPRGALREAADAAARQALMLEEAADAARMLRVLLDDLPPGEVLAPVPQGAGEGMAVVEGPRGPCLAWLRLDDGGLIAAAHLHDPAWNTLPVLEAALEGAALEDVSVIRASLPLNPAGMDG